MSKMNELCEYLQNRGVADKCYLKFVLKEERTDGKYKIFSVEGQSYMLSHFLD